MIRISTRGALVTYKPYVPHSSKRRLNGSWCYPYSSERQNTREKRKVQRKAAKAV